MIKSMIVRMEKALDVGPLESVFPGSTSKILDFLAVFKDWDYSISDIAKNAGISFKTALGEVKNLENQKVLIRTRTVGKATMYKLNVNSKQGFYVDKLAFEIAVRRATESLSSGDEKAIGKTKRKTIKAVKQTK